MPDFYIYTVLKIAIAATLIAALWIMWSQAMIGATLQF